MSFFVRTFFGSDEDRYPSVFDSDSEEDEVQGHVQYWSPVPRASRNQPRRDEETTPEEDERQNRFQRTRVLSSLERSNKGLLNSQLTQSLTKQASRTVSVAIPIGPVSSAARGTKAREGGGPRVRFAGENQPRTTTNCQPVSEFKAKQNLYFHTQDEVHYRGKGDNDRLIVRTLIEQERLRSKKLKIEEEASHRHHDNTSSTSSSPADSFHTARTTSDASASTYITIPDDDHHHHQAPWICHNCGTLNNPFDTPCWHCKIHSRCQACFRTTTTTHGEGEQFHIPPVQTRFNSSTLLNMPLTDAANFFENKNLKIRSKSTSQQKKGESASGSGGKRVAYGLLKGHVSSVLRAGATVAVDRGTVGIGEVEFLRRA